MTFQGPSTYAEEAIGPDIPIIEPHHHLYGVPDQYSRSDLLRDMKAGHNIVGTVFSECFAHYREDGPEHLKPVGETEWIMTQRGDGIAEGLVAQGDMFMGSEIVEVIEAHQEVAGSVLKGFRHNVGWDKHPDTNNAKRGAGQYALLDPTFQAGTAELAKRGLTFETWLYFIQLDDMAQLAQAQPDLPIVLNHLGGPAVNGPYGKDRPAMLATWREEMTKLAAHPNVVLKVGGLGYRSFVEQRFLTMKPGSEFLADYWRPEILFCIETFGPDRCMFETNYPEDAPLADFVVLWNTYKRITDGMSDADLGLLYSGTAQRVYTLPDLAGRAAANGAGA